MTLTFGEILALVGVVAAPLMTGLGLWVHRRTRRAQVRDLDQASAARLVKAEEGLARVMLDWTGMERLRVANLEARVVSLDGVVERQRREVLTLRIQLNSWKGYAAALVRKLELAGVEVPASPVFDLQLLEDER